MTYEELQVKRAKLTAERNKIIEELHQVGQLIHQYEDALKASDIVDGLSDSQRILVSKYIEETKVGAPGNGASN